MRDPRILIGYLVLCSSLAGCDGSSGDAARPSRPATVEPSELGPRGPALALGYAPGAEPTERAIAAAQESLRAAPDQPSAHVALATAFMRRARETSSGAYREYARDVIDAGRAQHPEHPRLRMLSAMSLLDGHRFEAAIDIATPLLALLPNDPTPHLLIGDASLELGRYARAETAYQAAIDLRPDLRSYNRVGYMRWLYGDFEGAVAALELALDSGSARDPESMAWCFTDLGAMHLRRGDTAPARAAAAAALELVDGYPPALALDARALIKDGELQAAQTRLQAAISAAPSAEELLRLAELRQARGDATGAAQTLAEAERLAAHDPRPLAHYWARHGSQPDRALALAREALNARQNLWAYDTLALASARAGDIPGARAAMKQARDLGLVDAEFSLHAALVELEGGNTQGARAELEAALRQDARVDPRLADEIRRRLGDA